MKNKNPVNVKQAVIKFVESFSRVYLVSTERQQEQRKIQILFLRTSSILQWVSCLIYITDLNLPKKNFLQNFQI